MKILEARIKGALGFLWGLGTEEVQLDFGKIPPGIVVLEGDNGTGKTTFLENLIPFPQMLTRSPSLYDHFAGLGERMLRLGLNGDIYTFRLVINADQRKTEGYVDVQRTDGQVETLTHGRMGEYQEVVERLFGDVEIFRRSVFASQGGGRFITLKRAGRKEMLAQVLGLSRYQLYEADAKSRGDRIKESIAMLKGKIEVLQPRADIGDRRERLTALGEKLQGIAERLKKLDAARSEAQVALTKATNDLSRASQDRMQRQKYLAELRTKKSDLDAARAGLAAAEDGAKSSLEQCDSKIERFQGSARSVDDLRKKVKALRERLDQHQERNTLAMKIETIKTQLDRSQQIYQDKYDLHVAFQGSIPCPKELRSVCPLFKSAQEKTPSEAELADLKVGLETALSKLTEAEGKYNELKPAPASFITDLDVLEAKLREGETAQAQIPLVQQQKGEITSMLQRARDQAQATIASLGKGIESVQAELEQTPEPADDADLRESLEIARANFDKIADDISILEEDKAGHELSIKLLENEIAAAEQAGQQIRETEAELRSLTIDHKGWQFLARACGRDGIPALKMEHSCQEIEAITNDLLQSAFGTEWRISIQTQEPSADGKRMLEALNVIVHRGAGDTPVENLSGGEEVWISRALELAIALLRVRSLNQPLETIFLDEADGALSEENAHRFYAVLEAAMRYGNLHRIFLISHRKAIQAAARNRLVFGDGRIEIV